MLTVKNTDEIYILTNYEDVKPNPCYFIMNTLFHVKCQIIRLWAVHLGWHPWLILFGCGSDVCRRGCAYKVLQMFQMFHYAGLSKLLCRPTIKNRRSHSIRVGYSPDCRVPSVNVMIVQKVMYSKL